MSDEGGEPRRDEKADSSLEGLEPTPPPGLQREGDGGTMDPAEERSQGESDTQSPQGRMGDPPNDRPRQRMGALPMGGRCHATNQSPEGTEGEVAREGQMMAPPQVSAKTTPVDEKPCLKSGSLTYASDRKKKSASSSEETVKTVKVPMTTKEALRRSDMVTKKLEVGSAASGPAPSEKLQVTPPPAVASRDVGWPPEPLIAGTLMSPLPEAGGGIVRTSGGPISGRVATPGTVLGRTSTRGSRGIPRREDKLSESNALAKSNRNISSGTCLTCHVKLAGKSGGTTVKGNSDGEDNLQGVGTQHSYRAARSPHINQDQMYTVMPTARVMLQGPRGVGEVESTALLDSGASQSFISQAAVERAGLKPRLKAGVPLVVVGVAGEVEADREVVVCLRSPVTGFKFRVTATVLPHLGKISGIPYELCELGINRNIVMSETYPTEERDLSFLFGQDILFLLYKEERVIRVWNQELLLHESHLGSVLSGHFRHDGELLPTKLSKVKDQQSLWGNLATAKYPQWHTLHPNYGRRDHREYVMGDVARAWEALGRIPLNVQVGALHKGQRKLTWTGQRKPATKKEMALMSNAIERGSLQDATGEVELENYHNVRNAKKSENKLPIKDDIEKQLSDFMTYEGLGIVTNESDQNHMKPNDILALKMWREKLSFDGKAYSVGLLIDPEHKPLGNNRDSAVAQFLALERKFKRDPEYFEAYKAAMKENQATDTELCTKPGVVGKTRYLPHQAVVNPDKPSSKFRIVYNGSAKSGFGPSLNECLLAGPASGCQDLFKILLGFRHRKVAFSGDVKRMYLAISVNEEDRDYIRFIWRNEETGELEDHRFKKIPFGIKDAPFNACETFCHHASQFLEEYPDVVKTLIFKRWLDDVLSSVDTEEEALEMIECIIKIMAKGGFSLKKWVSSSERVMNALPLEDRVDKDKPINFQDHTNEDQKALGIEWKVASDVLTFSKVGKVLPADLEITKRVLASVVAAFFDPIGGASPMSVKGKILLAEVWKKEKEFMDAKKAAGASAKEMDRLRKISWNKPVSKETAEAFREWAAELTKLGDFSMERCLVDKTKTVLKKELHFFSDASLWAFATTAYLRTTYVGGGVTSRLISSKSRVAKANDTMPRLELMGALLSTMMAKTVREALDPEGEMRSTFWVDSSTAFQWIVGDPNQWKLYVSNRVKEIQATTSKEQWRHVPGTENPADLATRGVTAAEFVGSKLWVEGPPWLVKDEQYWPDRTFSYKPLEDEVLEAKLESPATAMVVTRKQARKAQFQANWRTTKKLKSWDVLKYMRERTNSWEKVLRVTVLFMDKTRRGGVPQYTAEARSRALLKHVKHEQEQSYKAELVQLRQGQEVHAKSKLACLGPVLDEHEVIRVEGRYPPSEDSITPIMLPHKSSLVKLLVLGIHHKYQHQGPGWTLFHFRKQFWIPKGRRTVKEILAKCVRCRVLKASRLSQKMAPLPPFRLEDNPRPFTYVGVDYAGPTNCYNEEGKPVKAWFLLFTCLQMRAVHIELCLNLKVDTFLLATRRFVAHHGLSVHWYSDNAATFKAASKELTKLGKLRRKDTVINALREKGIKWTFNAEAAPWWGALYERLMRTIKESLRGAIGKDRLSPLEYETVLHEAAAVVNARPLAQINEDPADPLPVSPSMLMRGYDVEARAFEHAFKPMTEGRIHLLWRRRMYLAQQFMNRFQMGYIQELRERQKWNQASPPLKVGEIVIVEMPNKKRLEWPLARVLEVHEGKDGHVRSATLWCKEGYMTRPVQRLVSLEIVGESPDKDLEFMTALEQGQEPSDVEEVDSTESEEEAPVPGKGQNPEQVKVQGKGKGQAKGLPGGQKAGGVQPSEPGEASEDDHRPTGAF